jgi:hypothetical protein
MTDSTPNRPLYRMMHDAYESVVLLPGRNRPEGLAAELRAIAKEASKRLSPEESSYPHDGRDLVAWLRAEADRAEAGE